jgi:hypothetical protein
MAYGRIEPPYLLSAGGRNRRLSTADLASALSPHVGDGPNRSAGHHKLEVATPDILLEEP